MRCLSLAYRNHPPDGRRYCVSIPHAQELSSGKTVLGLATTDLSVEVVADDLNYPWDIKRAGDRILITEAGGTTGNDRAWPAEPPCCGNLGPDRQRGRKWPARNGARRGLPDERARLSVSHLSVQVGPCRQGHPGAVRRSILARDARAARGNSGSLALQWRPHRHRVLTDAWMRRRGGRKTACCPRTSAVSPVRSCA